MRASVVIPAFARPHKLERTLGALANQTALADTFEVIVVDDGSPEPLACPQHGSSAAVQWIRQENKGPAAARNRGVRAASGDIVILIGDDILPAPDFVASHLRWHHSNPDPLDAMLGTVNWLPECLSSDFMQWLDGSGLQFGYQGLHAGERLKYYHFYTANLSLKRELLVDHPFDEEFHHAAWEDTELGIRLTDAGVRLTYVPFATAWHDHVYDLESSCARFESVGQAARVFARKCPTYKNFRWVRRMPKPLRAAVGSPLYRWIADFAARQGDPYWLGKWFYLRNSEAFWRAYSNS